MNTFDIRTDINECFLLELYHTQNNTLILIFEIYPYLELTSNELKLVQALNNFNSELSFELLMRNAKENSLNSINYQDIILDNIFSFFTKTVDTDNKTRIFSNLLLGLNYISGCPEEVYEYSIRKIKNDVRLLNSSLDMLQDVSNLVINEAIETNNSLFLGFVKIVMRIEENRYSYIETKKNTRRKY